MNIMKGIAGTGCLALPVAVKNVGQRSSAHR